MDQSIIQTNVCLGRYSVNRLGSSNDSPQFAISFTPYCYLADFFQSHSFRLLCSISTKPQFFHDHHPLEPNMQYCPPIFLTFLHTQNNLDDTISYFLTYFILPFIIKPKLSFSCMIYEFHFSRADCHMQLSYPPFTQFYIPISFIC